MRYRRKAWILTDAYAIERLVKDIQQLGRSKISLRTDNEHAIFKLLKKAPENVQIDSKRQAEIQNIKMVANQHRQTLPMYSNSSMANMKNDLGSELVKNNTSSQHSRN